MKDKNVVERPNDEREFKNWLKSELGFEINNQYAYYYETVVQKLKKDFEESAFWKELLNNLPEINDKYRVNKGVYLLIPTNTPTILSKSLDSLVNKAYRKNILNNDQFPDPPRSGWITPENWFRNTNDIIRTSLTVKYLDGVAFIISELEELSFQYGYDFDSSFEAREEGYYAAHSGIKIPFSIPDMQFSPEDITLNIEIQVTTQIQEIIKTLLHKHYEENRRVIIPEDYKWQWDYQSPEFTSNYLGHIIHYVEGMIVEIRDREE